MADRQMVGWQGGQQTLNEHRVVILDHTGPTSYTQITPGTPPALPTGGDSITAAGCGLTVIEDVITGGDSSGTYVVDAFMPPLAINGTGGAAKTVQLIWCTAATGAQVAGTTNLSAAQVRLIVIGY